MRVSVFAACLSLCLIGFSAADDVHASIRKETNIPAEGLGPALNALAKDRNFQIVYVTEEIANVRTEGAVGEFTTEEALKRLLVGTGLTYRYLDEKTVTIGFATHPKERSGRASQTTSSGSTDDTNANQEAKKSFLDNFHLAQANQGTPHRSAAVGGDIQSTSGSSENSPKLTEIIVTAQKRTERLQDVPIAMTVLDTESLAENGQNRLVDYFSTVPGLNLAASAGGGGTQYLTIRGISAGEAQNPTVATVIDDIPISAGTYWNFGNVTAPDLDPSDLARIEVLRGPQGTLYGSDSLGGLIKFVTTDPSTTAFSGRVEGSGVDIPGGGLGYTVRGAANVPVSDQLAIRASAFYRQDPGYIDDLTTGQRNFNSADTYGGRISALWRPSDNLSLKVSGLIQETRGDTSEVNSNGVQQFPQGDLNFTGLPGSSAYYRQQQFYSAVLTAKVAGVDITSLTGYAINKLLNWTDVTAYVGGPGGLIGNYSPGSLAGTEKAYYDTAKVSQEVRVSSSIGHWLDWRVGGFYTHETTPEGYFNLYGATPAGSVVGPVFDDSTSVTLTEYAAFGDVTIHITDRFDVQLGGRESWYRQAQQDTFTGPGVHDFTNGHLPPYVQPELTANNSAFTYQVTPRFKISPDLMVYARVATGYRIGGGNANSGLAIVEGIPTQYDPDKTINYEIGIKGDALDHRLSFDAAAYYIDWSHFQISVTKPYMLNGASLSASYIANAGDAKSEGVEFSFQARPATGLTIAAHGSFDNAVLTQDLPAASAIYGLTGDRLPYSMRFSGGLDVSQDIRLSNDWVGFLGGAVNYVGSRPYEFVTAPPPGSPPPSRIEFPAFTQFNLRAGARRDQWLINLYVNNVADRRGIVGLFPAGAVGVTGGDYATVIQPRTVGLSVSRNF